MKNAILCGFGMAVDLSGNTVHQTPGQRPDFEMIGSDFRAVGQDFQIAIEKEGRQISLEAKEREARQLKLQLAGA